MFFPYGESRLPVQRYTIRKTYATTQMAHTDCMADYEAQTVENRAHMV